MKIFAKNSNPKLHQIISATLLSLLLCLLISPQTKAAEYYLSDGSMSAEELALSLGVDSELFCAINNIEPDDVCPTGLFTLPEQPVMVITVQAGDTMYSLAHSYGVSVDELAAENNISDPTSIFPGQKLYCPMPEESTSVAGAIESSEVRSVAVSASSSRGSSSAGSWLWPAQGFISSAYGQRTTGYHYGMDIAADNKSEVVAAAAGRISESGWKSDAYGYTVMIDHSNGLQTLYAHCSSLVAKVGDSVTAGQLIAYIGSTGNSTGPHVHFEVRQNGECVDPAMYLP